MIAQISEFRMPRYREIPDVGLYLDQTVKYMNRYLAPLGCMEITTSMVSNYVKKGYISNPVRKQYSAEQIAYLLFIAVAKSCKFFFGLINAHFQIIKTCFFYHFQFFFP